MSISGFMKLEIYVPTSHVEQVKAAICEAGAGKLGNYDSCVWQTVGTGQFRPLDGSNPYLGTANQVEKVEEAKLECICNSMLMGNILGAMRKAHPYETPAYQYWPVFI